MNNSATIQFYNVSNLQWNSLSLKETSSEKSHVDSNFNWIKYNVNYSIHYFDFIHHTFHWFFSNLKFGWTKLMNLSNSNFVNLSLYSACKCIWAMKVIDHRGNVWVKQSNNFITPWMNHYWWNSNYQCVHSTWFQIPVSKFYCLLHPIIVIPHCIWVILHWVCNILWW